MATHLNQEMEVIGQSAWPNLLSELLERIMDILDPLDCAVVRLVCPSWRKCAQKYFPSDVPFEVPRLLFCQPGRGRKLAFFSLQHKKILPFKLPVCLRAGRCCGQIDGWLAMVFDSDRAIILFNPASGRSVTVPTPPMFPVKKIVLSRPPTSVGWHAAVLGRTGMIALFQPIVSSTWITMGIKEGVKHGGFTDMAFWCGRLCALGHDGLVLAFQIDLQVCAGKVSLLRNAEHAVGAPQSSDWQRYLIEMEGVLLMVRKLYRSLDHNKVNLGVKVLLMASSHNRRWDPVVEIPTHSLFVGSVVSTAIPMGMYPTSGLHNNCIYFAQREVEMLVPHAISEYSLKHDEIKGFPIMGRHSTDVEPVWIVPFI